MLVSGTPRQQFPFAIFLQHIATKLIQNLSSPLLGLFVSWNLLTGTIPTEIGLLDSLVVLQISSNEFTGQLPSEVGNLQQLEALLISRQGLDSTIPTEIGLLHSSLSSFQAKGTGLKGTIPDSVYELSKLRVLDLANNFLTGSISSEISLLTSLYRLGLDDNGFGGDIPDELGELGSDDSSNGFGVQYVSLHRNPMLTGKSLGCMFCVLISTILVFCSQTYRIICPYHQVPFPKASVASNISGQIVTRTLAPMVAVQFVAVTSQMIIKRVILMRRKAFPSARN